ncbi:MAG TPA: hypothetical protein VH092_11505 [Urbifossiella sp.]|jgi:hypothetical protein|nr:hypothetical protein [Urbifossiella sp.]
MNRRVWIAAGVTVILAGLGVGLIVGVEHVRESAARANCNLGQLGLAFHLYADQHDGRLPPAAVCDPGGRRSSAGACCSCRTSSSNRSSTNSA